MCGASTSTDKDLATFQQYANNPVIKGPPAGLDILAWTGLHQPLGVEGRRTFGT